MKYIRKKTIYILLSVLFLVGLCCKIDFNNNISGILQAIENYIYTGDDIYERYMEEINLSETQNGIDVELQKAAADNNILILDFVVKSDYELNGEKLDLSKLMVNGSKVNGEYVDYVQCISPYEFRISKKIYWNYDGELSDLNLDIVINKISNRTGQWNFKFSILNERIVDNVYVEDLNQRIIMNDFNSTIEKVIYSPLTVSITYSENSKSSGNIMFIAFENDTELKRVNLKNSTKKYVFNSKFCYEELRIVPIYHLDSREEEKLESVKVNLKEFHQFYLDINDDLKLKIEDCFSEDDKIVIKYRLEYMGMEMNERIADLYMNDKDGTCKEASDKELEYYKEKYGDDNSHIAVFESAEEDTVEIGCYDGTKYEVLDDEVIEVKKVLNDEYQ